MLQKVSGKSDASLLIMDEQKFKFVDFFKLICKITVNTQTTIWSYRVDLQRNGPEDPSSYSYGRRTLC